MSKLDVAILTKEVGSNSGSRVAVELARHLAKLRNDITIYSYKNIHDKAVIKNLKKLKVKIVSVAKNPGFLASVLPDKTLVSLLKKNKHEIVISCAPLPFLFSAKLAGLPVVRVYMGTQFDAYLENKPPGEPLNIFEKVINLAVNAAIYLAELTSSILSNHIIAISNYCAWEAKKLYFRKPAKVIYLGGNHLPSLSAKNQLPASPAKRDEPPARNQKPLQLLTVSRITPYKGFHRLIKTLNNFSSRLDLTIVGSPIKPKYYHYLKKISHKNIRFIKSPDDSTLDSLYSSCDCYITADKNLFFGLPIAEAAFFQKPTIAFKYAAAAEVIDDSRTGFVVESQQKLDKLLKSLIKNPNSLTKLGQNAYKKAVDQFLWEKIARQYQDFLEKIT